MKVKVRAEDALQMALEEVLSISFKEGKTDQTKLNYNLSPHPLPTILPDFRESILFNKPIKALKETLIYFECKNQEKIALKTNGSGTLDRTKLTIRKHFTPEEIMEFVTKEEERSNKRKMLQQVVTLQLEPGAGSAFDQSTHKNISHTYPLRQKEATGTISGSIETTTPNFIIELLNQKDEPIDSIRNTKTYQFKMIPPGSYRMRLLVLN